MPRPDDHDYTHGTPNGYDGLWSDTSWTSVMDLEAGVCGENHFTLTNGGYGRCDLVYEIDGTRQVYASQFPFELKSGISSWGDDNFECAVVEPFQRISLRHRGSKFDLDLEYTARYPIFDWDDCPGGNPVALLAQLNSAAGHGGHYEQAVRCEGEINVKGGPRPGVRAINCLAGRDHTWSDRFNDETPWDYPAEDIGCHTWFQLHSPTRMVAGYMILDPRSSSGGEGANIQGGFESSPDGNVAVVSVNWNYTGTPSGLRDKALPFDFVLGCADGRTISVRTEPFTELVKLPMRGVDYLENRMDLYHSYSTVMFDDNGETGYGILENSVYPPRPRWCV